MQFDIDMQSEHKEMFNSARNILLEQYQLKETKKERISSYTDDNGGICHMRTMKHGLDIGFLKGIHIDDKYKLLSGSGKVMRVFSMTELNSVQLRYYIEQAIAVNAAR